MWFPTLKNTKIIDLQSGLEVTSEQLTKMVGATSNAATNGALATPITEIYSGYTTNGTAAIAASLADGVDSQIKVIKLETFDTNNLVVTPANLTEGSTLTFDATGEIAILMFVGTSWQILYNTSTLA